MLIIWFEFQENILASCILDSSTTRKKTKTMTLGVYLIPIYLLLINDYMYYLSLERRFKHHLVTEFVVIFLRI